MAENNNVDYYEILQVSQSADPETVHRVYRFLAQRFHPDNAETGNEARFREIHQAYTVISDAEQRARYDITYQQHRKERWRLVSAGAQSENDFELEQSMRLMLLEALYTKRRLEPDEPAIFAGDLESLLGRAREQLQFTIWFLQQKKFVTRDDNSRLLITADGVEFLEQNYKATTLRRLHGHTASSPV
jgi:curved DNA-binding protein CbpA